MKTSSDNLISGIERKSEKKIFYNPKDRNSRILQILNESGKKVEILEIDLKNFKEQKSTLQQKINQNISKLVPIQKLGRPSRRPTRPVRLKRPTPKTPPVPFFFDLPRRTPKRSKKKKIKGRGLRPPIEPSFTGIVLDLKGLFPKEIKLGKVKLGISPRQIRTIPIRRN
ncbi:hypothetical protein LCGC14_2797800, partial [marine sediment metagenome]